MSPRFWRFALCAGVWLWFVLGTGVMLYTQDCACGTGAIVYQVAPPTLRPALPPTSSWDELLAAEDALDI